MDGSAPSFCTLALAALRVWSGNPRKTVGDVTDLAASIRAHGVAEPLLVRSVTPTSADHGATFITHEILAGQRRYHASLTAGLEVVPCIVREMPDDAALELGLIENSQRENPSPLEEAEAIDRLTREHGRSIEHVADKLGRTPAWVRRRLTLLSLCEAARERMRRGELPLAHAERLAAVDEATQARVLSRYRDELPASGAFARDVVFELHALDQAPFDVDDTKLPGGSCSKCPKRSDTQVDLFGGATGDARCLDAACWSKKSDVTWSRAEKAAKKRGLPIIDARGVLASYGLPGTMEYTAPYLSEPPTPDAQPVAITRHFRGHVVELYAKPPRVATQAIVTKKDLEDADDDELAAREAEREAKEAEKKDAREAATRAKIEKLLAVTNSGRGLTLLFRVAAQALSLAGFERDYRAVARAINGHAAPVLAVDELVSDDDAPRAIAAALAHEWALGVSEEYDHTDAEKELRALLDAPLAAKAPVFVLTETPAPRVGCADCGDVEALLRPGEHARCPTCKTLHSRNAEPMGPDSFGGTDYPEPQRTIAKVETSRVWIAESEWDALDGGMQNYLGEIEYDGPARAVIEWQGTEGFVYADVAVGPVLDELRVTLRQSDIPFFEGAERPSTEPPKPTKKARAKKASKVETSAPAAPVMTDADRAEFARGLDEAHPPSRAPESVPEYLRDLAERAIAASDGAWWVVVTAGLPTLSDRFTVSRCPDLDTARARVQFARATDASSKSMHRLAVFAPDGAIVDELTWTRVMPTSPTLAKHPGVALFRVSAPIGDVSTDAQQWALSRGLCWYAKSFERLTAEEALAGDAFLYWQRQNGDAVTIVPRDLVLFVERRAAAPRDDGSTRAELRIEPWTVEWMRGHYALRDDSTVIDLDDREWRVLHMGFEKVSLSIDEDTVGEASLDDLSPKLDGTSRWWGAVKLPKAAKKTRASKKGGAK